MQKWWHVSPTRIVIALVAVFALMWMIGQAVQWLAPWTEARSMLRENPALAQIPVASSDQSLATLSGFRVELFGISVQTPWDKPGTIRMVPGLAVVPFPGQHVAMMLFAPTSQLAEKRLGYRNRHDGFHSWMV